MARYDGKNLTGVIGNLVHKRGRDKGITIIQLKPHTVKQTANSKTTASIFGNASSLGKVLRDDFDSINAGLNDGRMVNRLNTNIRAIFEHCFNKKTSEYTFDDSSFNNIKGFEFNIHSLLANHFWAEPVTIQDGEVLKVTIPQFDVAEQLKFPGNTNACEISILVSYVVLQQALTKNNATQSFDISKDQQTVDSKEFSFHAPLGCLCVVAMGLKYFTRSENTQTVFNTKAFNPAAIIGQTLTPGTFIDPPARVENGRHYGKEWKVVDKLRL